MSRRLRRSRRARRRLWVAAGAGALALACVGGWLVTRGGGDGGSAAVGTPARGSETSMTTTTTTSASVPPTTTAPAPTSPATAPPAVPAGPPYAVGVSRATLVDSSRPTAARGPTPAASSRTLPVVVRYPAEGAAGTQTAAATALAGKYPLVVFAHGYDISADDYAGFEGDLAAQGFVVVAPDFPLSSTAFPGPPTQADIDEQARDVSFVADQLRSNQASGPWSGHVAGTEVGVVGHSDGGNTAARVASNSCCFDSRFGAAAILSGDEGSSGGQWAVAGSAPMLFVQGTNDSINPWPLTQQLYDDATSPKMLVAIDGASHLEPYTTGPQRGAVAALVAAFLRARLVDATTVGQVNDRANRDGLRLVASS